MNASEAIAKIADLLGMKFKEEKFFITKLIDGETEITNNQEGPFTIGDNIFVVDGSVLKPAPVGSHETREGLILTVDEAGVIMKIEEKPESAEEERVAEANTDIESEVQVMTEKMTEATLADGTKIMTDDTGDFQVGQKLYVETQSGEKAKAPSGEHTTESGIVVSVDDEGFITGVKYPDEEGEGSLEEYRKKMDDMKTAMGKMLEMMSQFSNDLSYIKKDYEEFKNSPVFDKPVAKKTFGKENILDAKLEFLKGALGNQKK